MVPWPLRCAINTGKNAWETAAEQRGAEEGFKINKKDSTLEGKSKSIIGRASLKAPQKFKNKRIFLGFFLVIIAELLVIITQNPCKIFLLGSKRAKRTSRYKGFEFVELLRVTEKINRGKGRFETKRQME